MGIDIKVTSKCTKFVLVQTAYVSNAPISEYKTGTKWDSHDLGYLPLPPNFISFKRMEFSTKYVCILRVSINYFKIIALDSNDLDTLIKTNVFIKQ